METRKIFYMVVVVDALLMALLLAVSVRFLTDQWRRSNEIEPEIMEQYSVSLEVEEFLELVKQLKSREN